jgi:hypothetical protein
MLSGTGVRVKRSSATVADVFDRSTCFRKVEVTMARPCSGVALTLTKEGTPLTLGKQKNYPVYLQQESSLSQETASRPMSPRKSSRKPQSTNGSEGSHPQESTEDLLPARAEEASPALLMESRPEVYQKCVDYLESGMSPGGAAALCNISVGLARKIRNLLGPDALHAAIRAAGRNMIESAQLLSERMVNEGHKIPIHLVPQALGTMVDKSLLVTGEPTQRIEVQHVPTHEELQKMFDALPQIKTTPITPPSDITPSSSDTPPPSP